MPETGKVRIFISSTIYDFQDLRSALKFWLEEMGFEVLNSEVNDFDRRPDSGTFDACFEAIESCNYFVILVGNRAGSEFESGLSVTHAEFKHARCLMNEGKIHIVPLIRGDVRTALRNQNDAEALNTLRITPSESSIAQIQGVRTLIRDIEDTEIPLAPSENGGKLWVYEFSSFSDIADTMKVALGANRTLRKQVLLSNLKIEIEFNLGQLFSKLPTGLPIAYHRNIREHRNEFPIRDMNPLRTVVVPRMLAGNIAQLKVISSPRATQLHKSDLDACVRSGEFLRFNTQSKALEESPELAGMRALADEINAVQSITAIFEEQTQSEAIAGLYADYRAERVDSEVTEFLLTTVYAFCDRLENIIALLVVLHDWIANPGIEFVMPDLIPSSPIAGAAERFERERFSAEDVRSFLARPEGRNCILGNA